MEISFSLNLPSCEIHVTGNFPCVPRIGETVDLTNLLDENYLEEYHKHVIEFPFVVDVHHRLELKDSSIHVLLSVDV